MGPSRCGSPPTTPRARTTSTPATSPPRRGALGRPSAHQAHAAIRPAAGLRAARSPGWSRAASSRWASSRTYWDLLGVTSLRALNAPFLITNQALLADVISGDLGTTMLSGSRSRRPRGTGAAAGRPGSPVRLRPAAAGSRGLPGQAAAWAPSAEDAQRGRPVARGALRPGRGSRPQIFRRPGLSFGSTSGGNGHRERDAVRCSTRS